MPSEKNPDRLAIDACNLKAIFKSVDKDTQTKDQSLIKRSGNSSASYKLPLPRELDKPDEGTIKVFSFCQVIQDPECPTEVTIVRETVTEEVHPHKDSPTAEENYSNKYKYCKEVIRPYLKEYPPDCPDSEDLLVRDAIEAANEEFPDYPPCYQIKEPADDLKASEKEKYIPPISSDKSVVSKKSEKKGSPKKPEKVCRAKTPETSSTKTSEAPSSKTSEAPSSKTSEVTTSKKSEPPKKPCKPSEVSPTKTPETSLSKPPEVPPSKTVEAPSSKTPEASPSKTPESSPCKTPEAPSSKTSEGQPCPPCPPCPPFEKPTTEVTSKKSDKSNKDITSKKSDKSNKDITSKKSDKSNKEAKKAVQANKSSSKKPEKKKSADSERKERPKFVLCPNVNPYKICIQISDPNLCPPKSQTGDKCTCDSDTTLTEENAWADSGDSSNKSEKKTSPKDYKPCPDDNRRSRGGGVLEEEICEDDDESYSQEICAQEEDYEDEGCFCAVSEDDICHPEEGEEFCDYDSSSHTRDTTSSHTRDTSSSHTRGTISSHTCDTTSSHKRDTKSSQGDSDYFEQEQKTPIYNPYSHPDDCIHVKLPRHKYTDNCIPDKRSLNSCRTDDCILNQKSSNSPRSADDEVSQSASRSHKNTDDLPECEENKKPQKFLNNSLPKTEKKSSKSRKDDYTSEAEKKPSESEKEVCVCPPVAEKKPSKPDKGPPRPPQGPGLKKIPDYCKPREGKRPGREAGEPLPDKKSKPIPNSIDSFKDTKNSKVYISKEMSSNACKNRDRERECREYRESECKDRDRERDKESGKKCVPRCKSPPNLTGKVSGLPVDNCQKRGSSENMKQKSNEYNDGRCNCEKAKAQRAEEQKAEQQKIEENVAKVSGSNCASQSNQAARKSSITNQQMLKQSDQQLAKSSSSAEKINKRSPHNETLATLKCAMEDFMCKVFRSTQDAVSVIASESAKQFDKFRKSGSSTDCPPPPKKVNASNSRENLRTFSLVNVEKLATDCKEPPNCDEENDKSPGKEFFDKLVSKVDSTISMISSSMNFDIPVSIKPASYNDQYSKFDVPTPKEPPKEIENILSPGPSTDIYSNIRSKIWSMFIEDENSEVVSKGSVSSSSVSSESDEDLLSKLID